MYRRNLIWCAILLLSAILVACGSGQTRPEPTAELPTPTATPALPFDAESPARILRLDSYHVEYAWSIAVNAGFKRALAEYDYSEEIGNVVFDYFYMDTKRNNDSAYFESIAQEARAYIEETQPDLIQASDNNAVRLVVQPLAGTEIPIVFNGLNDEPQKYGLVEVDNVTGVLERAYIEETFSWIARVFPDATRITCLLDDSVTTAAYIDEMRTALEQSIFAGSPVHLTNDFEEWQSVVQQASEDSTILVIGTYHTLQDAEGQPLNENTVLDWTVENSTIPVVAYWEFSVPLGALGGVVISGDTQGYEAGRLAGLILNGESPGSIPIVTPGRGKLMINREAMQRWDVSIPLELLEISEIYEP